MKKFACMLVPMAIAAATIGYSCKSAKVIKEVSLRCYYMAYACGDCTPQYQVRAVYNPSEITNELLGKDISIEFGSDKEEANFDRSVRDCAICYWYDLKGDLTESGKNYTLYVKEYKLVLKSKDCCESATPDQ